MLLLGHPCPREPEERREDDRDPEQPVGRVVARTLRDREVEHDERRENEEEHRRQRVPPAQLDAQILARECHDVGEVRHASASRAVWSAATRSGSCVVSDDGAPAREPRELAIEERRAALVERRERLVENEQVGLVEKRPAQREPLRHATRVRRHALVARLPEREALEQHPDALAPLRDAVEPAEEVEVLHRGQLPVDERLVGEVADARTIGVHEEIASRRVRQPCEQAQKRRLPAAVRPGHHGEPTAWNRDVDPAQHALASVPLLDATPADHPTSTSSATKAKKTTLITPFSVKKAASSLRRSPGRTIECS